MSDSNLLLGVSAAYLIIASANKKRRKKRSLWVKNYLKNRNFGIIDDLQLDEDILFRNFTRMSQANFYSILKIIEPEIVKQNTRFREAVPAKIKLLITLRYLATGDSFSSLMYLFKVSKPFISTMLPTVLKAIINALQNYIKLPSSDQEWKSISNEFNKLWNFPHCFGAIDGKHVVIQKPENTISEFHNYKGTNSIVLLGIADANYRFLYVNVGCQGRISDGGVFKNTSFYKKLEKNELNLPENEPLPGRTLSLPYVLVADDAFPLTEHIMKPYNTDLNKGSPKRVYNYRLSRARRIIENTFGLLSSVFRVFRKPIEIKVEDTIINIVLACVYLHNFLRVQPDSRQFYSTSGCFDSYDTSTGEIIPGSWREITSGDTGLRPFRSIPRRPATTAKNVREEFMSYFMSEIGSVPFQDIYL
ncbi:PREDICTED: uncharacterized protein LOC107172114 [Diuraphis noxia]|uniref:uncharacterized protein LOC107172114 n=1 Tax=Diuraphis noxia TaxID=143948 RepID=UPI0007636CEC|nr:PREDICTED: uncharacterized protein LOC107172114 [Diuraphis noxia]